jgi:hypothetical protein
MQDPSGLRRACNGGLTLLLALCSLSVTSAQAGSSASPVRPLIVADHPRQPAASARTANPADVGWFKMDVGVSYPGEVWWATEIYDPVRDRILVYGGESWPYPHRDVLALSLGDHPTWTEFEPHGTPAQTRCEHSAIYDPVRDRMIVFGGSLDGTLTNDVRALSLGDDPTWTELEPGGIPPRPRCAHSAIYDPMRDRMIVFGGWVGDSVYSETWALSLAGRGVWTKLMPSGEPPPARCEHNAVYDPLRDRMLVLGGWASDGWHSDVWALSLGDTLVWTKLNPSGAAPRVIPARSVICDPAGDRVIVCSCDVAEEEVGEDDLGPRIWALSLTDPPAWTEPHPSGPSPGPRSEKGTIYDATRGRLVMYGGVTASGVALFDDAWALSLSDPMTWTALSPDGLRPAGRCGHTAICTEYSMMFVFGGGGTAGLFNDVWLLDAGGANEWTKVEPAGPAPSARMGHSAICDQASNRMVVFGGRDSSGDLNDVWTLSLGVVSTWTKLSPAGVPPAAREGHSAMYDPIAARMVVFGGESPSGLLNDVWALSLGAAPTWTKLSPAGGPPAAREGHSVIYEPALGSMVVFGGDDGWGGHVFDDLWVLSLGGSPSWTVLDPGGESGWGRSFHSAVRDPVRDRMVVFGGYESTVQCICDWEAWAVSLEWPSARDLLGTHPSPGARAGHSAVVYYPTTPRVRVFGGVQPGCKFGFRFYNDVWDLVLEPMTGQVEPQADADASAILSPRPNPTGGSTTVRYCLARAGRMELGVYDLGGRLVSQLVNEERWAGAGSAVWDGTDRSGARAGAGVYFVRLSGPGVHQIRKLVLMR